MNFRTRLGLWLTSVFLVAGAASVAAQRPVIATFHDAEDAASGNGTVAQSRGHNTVTIQNVIADSWDGTLTFEATVDGTNYVAVSCLDITSLALSTTGTGDGLWRCDIGGFASVRARISSRTTGSTTTTGILMR